MTLSKCPTAPHTIQDTDDTSRFEEIHDSRPELGSKRARESDDEEEEPPKPAVNGTQPGQKLSKKEKKKLKKLKKLAQAAEEPPAKKVKGVDGQAVPVAAPEKKTESGKNKKKDKKEKKEKSEAKEVKQTNGLITKDAKVGAGAMAKRGSKVAFRYIGKLTNGKMFDSNTNGKPVRSLSSPPLMLTNRNSCMLY